MKEILLKGLSTGIVASAGTYFLFGGSGGTAELQNSLMVGGAVGGGSVASDLISENIIEKLNLPQNVKSLEELLVRSSICGASSTAILVGVVGMPTDNILKSVALGAGSKLGGDYTYQMVLSPQQGFLPIF